MNSSDSTNYPPYVTGQEFLGKYFTGKYLVSKIAHIDAEGTEASVKRTQADTKLYGCNALLKASQN
jgi:hypothetical protein